MKYLRYKIPITDFKISPATCIQCRLVAVFVFKVRIWRRAVEVSLDFFHLFLWRQKQVEDEKVSERIYVFLRRRCKSYSCEIMCCEVFVRLCCFKIQNCDRHFRFPNLDFKKLQTHTNAFESFLTKSTFCRVAKRWDVKLKHAACYVFCVPTSFRFLKIKMVSSWHTAVFV